MSNRRIGLFELEQKLGVGGMGIVYLARYVKDGRKVAIKVLTPALSSDARLLKRFEREMEILKRLDQQNIVRYYGGGKTGAQSYYAMEYMEGGSVEDLLKQKRRLTWEQTIEFARQIAAALKHAHYHGIVHRDLKPANLFLRKDGRLKLGDFGIARDTEATALTAAGRTVGTYAYMAPEQISGSPPVSRKTDLYALGCVMYEMLTGKPPFEASNPAEMLMKHLEILPDRPTTVATDCPLWLEELVLGLLEKEPDDRPFDAQAVMVQLDEIGEKIAQQQSITRQTVAGDATAAGTRTTKKTELRKLLGRKKKKKKRGPFYEQLWFLVSCLVLLVAGLTWLLWPASEEQLFAEAMAHAASEEVVERRESRELLKSFIERFPDSGKLQQVREKLDAIEMELKLAQAKKRVNHRRQSDSPGERMLIEALRAEQSEDRITALHKYRSMIPLLEGQEKERHYRLLARQRITDIQRAAGENEDLELINDALRRARDYLKKGQKVKADALWSSIITHYGNNREFEQHVAYARARLQGKQPEPLDFEQNKPKKKARSR